MRAVTCAIAEGLPLRVLRLQRMGLDGDALQPLLHLMQTETQRCLASDGALAGATGFCIEELDLSGNHLDPTLLEAIKEGLQLLRTLREGFRDRAPQELPLSSRAERETEQLQPRPLRRHCRRARSEPGKGNVSSSPTAIVEALARDAMSDGEGYLDTSSHDMQDSSQIRETFLLQRAEDKHRFHKDAADLTKREVDQQRHRAACSTVGKESWADIPLAIAGVMGPSAAQSLVRQAVLAELRVDLARQNSMDATCIAHSCERHGEVAPSSKENRRVASFQSSGDDFPLRLAGNRFPGLMAPANAEQSDATPYAEIERIASSGQWNSTANSTALVASASSSDGEAETEAQLLRDCRLDQLREAVLGVLAEPLPSQAMQVTATFGSEEQPMVLTRGGLPDLKLQKMHQETVEAAGDLAFYNMQRSAATDRLFDSRLDDMHREALGDLRLRMTST